jgi:heme/copper-type cytochrome/quinol oxidase subunit 4
MDSYLKNKIKNKDEEGYYSLSDYTNETFDENNNNNNMNLWGTEIPSVPKIKKIAAYTYGGQNDNDEEEEENLNLNTYTYNGPKNNKNLTRESILLKRSSSLNKSKLKNKQNTEREEDEEEKEEEEEEEENKFCNNFACKKNGGFCLIWIIFVVLSLITLFLFLIPTYGTWVKILLILSGALGIALFALIIFYFCKNNRMWAALFTAIIVYAVLLGMVLFAIFYPKSNNEA